uniref:SF3A2 domain-containing protein n=1 Tax=Aegilops tauschii subsp. strangulata TaxID=200361 RepID=A0A453IGB6_AEGTS
QKIQSWDKRYQYLLFAAEPYEVIGFKRYQAQRLTNQQTSFSRIGIRTRSPTFCNYTSSQ